MVHPMKKYMQDISSIKPLVSSNPYSVTKHSWSLLFEWKNEKPNPTKKVFFKFYTDRLPSHPKAEALALLLKALWGFSFILLIFFC